MNVDLDVSSDRIGQQLPLKVNRKGFGAERKGKGKGKAESEPGHQRVSKAGDALVFSSLAPVVLLDFELATSLESLPEPVPLIRARALVPVLDVLSLRELDVPPPSANSLRAAVGDERKGRLESHVRRRSAGDHSGLEDESLASNVIGRAGQDLHRGDAAEDRVLEG